MWIAQRNSTRHGERWPQVSTNFALVFAPWNNASLATALTRIRNLLNGYPYHLTKHGYVLKKATSSLRITCVSSFKQGPLELAPVAKGPPIRLKPPLS